MVSIPGTGIREGRSSTTGSGAEMKTFWACEVQEAQMRKGAAVPAVFDAGPGELGVKIIAAVEVDGAGHGAGCERLAARCILGPDGSGETLGAVVHDADAFLFSVHGH